MPATNAGAEIELNALRGAITHVAAALGTTETGSARQPYSFPAAVGKTLSQTADVDIDMPDTNTADTLRFFNAAIGGTELYYIEQGSVSSNPSPGADWVYRVDSAQISISP